MIEALNSETVSLVKLALEVAQANQKVIANNIANINADNGVGMKLNFAEIYNEQLQGHLQNHDADAINKIKSDVAGGDFIEEKSGAISLENELIAMTDNVIRYRTLLNALSSRGAIMKMAIQGRSA